MEFNYASKDGINYFLRKDGTLKIDFPFKDTILSLVLSNEQTNDLIYVLEHKEL